MSMEKRLVLFLLLAVGSMYGMQLVLDELGMMPKPQPRPPVARKPAEPAPDVAVADADIEPQAPDKPAPLAPADTDAADAIAAAEPDSGEAGPQDFRDEVEVVAETLILGSLDPDSPYELMVRLDQAGAGVAELRTGRFEAEIQDDRPRGRPLDLILPRGEGLRARSPEPFTINLFQALDDAEKAIERERVQQLLRAQAESDVDVEVPVDLPELDERQIRLDRRLWEVVRDENGNAVRPIARRTGENQPTVPGQEVVFRATIGPQQNLTVTKTYRIWAGAENFELALTFSSPEDEQELAYNLLGPHRMPIEGEWYTGTFRDVFFGLNTEAGVEIQTISAYDVVKHEKKEGYGQEQYTRPLAYAGVENQYFAVFLQPDPVPDSPEKSRIEFAVPVMMTDPGQDWQKGDISVLLRSKPIEVGPNREVTHKYVVFAGPKTVEALEPYDAFELSTFRKGWRLWVVGDFGASFMSKYFIRPLLSRIYLVTDYLATLIGFQNGNWGVAIILLTIVVRLILFPLGRKQARAAKKMQDLQPLMMELKEKYKDNKEKLTQETFGLYKQYGVNPLGGCLPAIIQLPVLIGLWQTLNNSVPLRHSSFLWIDNLAAPDMLFKFPFTIPLVGQWLGPYFNLLPIIVVALMLIQTKLFAPPATTPEAEQQQKMMKYMMIFMAFIFYKLPAGLGVYFITSSLWQIGERLLLPKSTLVLKNPPGPREADSAADRGKAGQGGDRQKPGSSAHDGPGRGNGADTATKGGFWADLRARAEQLVQDADKKERTVRKVGDAGGDRNRGRERGDRDRGRNRPKPGRNR